MGKALEGIRRRLPRGLVDQPFEYLISWVFLLSATGVLIGAGQSHTLKGYGPGSVFFYYWCVSCLIGNPLILLGLGKAARAKRVGKVLMGWRLERLGLILQGSATVVLGVIIVSARGSGAILSSILYVTLALAYGTRLLVLNAKERDLRGLAEPPNPED